MSKLKDYIEGLLELIAAELNVKQVICNWDDVMSIYSYDTVENKNLGIDDEWMIWSNFFTGNILNDMEIVRSYCSQGMRKRQDAKIPVRQPLSSFTISK